MFECLHIKCRKADKLKDKPVKWFCDYPYGIKFALITERLNNQINGGSDGADV